MKRLFSLFLVVAMLLSTLACATPAATTEEAPAADSAASATEAPAAETEPEPEAEEDLPYVVLDDGTQYPDKNITVIVPFDAGGNADLSMRALCSAANQGGFFNGYQLIVENVGGGGAVTGQTQAWMADPDGYTMMLYTNSVQSNTVFNDVPYKYDDWLPITLYNIDPEVLYAAPDAPFDTVDEFFEYARNNKVIAATPGHTTGHHIRLELLGMEFGFRDNLEYLHMGSASEQLLQVMGGHAMVAMNTIGATASANADGTIKILAIQADERSEFAPDVPTFAELGYQIVDGPNRGIAIRKGVDEKIYQYILDEFERVCATDLFQQLMGDINAIGSWCTAEYMQQYMDKNYQDYVDFAELLKEELD